MPEVPELDGEWDVRRVSGFLPPLVGIRKRIEGESGATVLPGGLRVPLAVAGTELRYRQPFGMVVDVLEPDGEDWRGRTTVFGRAVGEFRMTRRAT